MSKTKLIPLSFLIFLCLSLASMAQIGTDLDNTIDPSGNWSGESGDLSLMLSGDALSFSFSSVFGSAVHICDGAGVAGLVGKNEYHYVDEQGTMAFMVADDGVQLHQVSGVASFCGAQWPGETFTRTGYHPLARHQVRSDKAQFYIVMQSPPGPRKGYVLKGDWLETVPCHHEGAQGFVLARFKGKKSYTVGLIQIKDLEVTAAVH